MEMISVHTVTLNGNRTDGEGDAYVASAEEQSKELELTFTVTRSSRKQNFSPSLQEYVTVAKDIGS